ncbi:MAG: hypothetical protein H6825_09660 [Planctomycetes bacterium]|nr:hypothetical protein [Planctomycetota bacterium]
MTRVTEAEVGRILTRTTGYLRTVTSHSLQPYRGCAFGNALCGVGCYVRHNRWLLRGQAWGSFLEARTNAAECFLAEHARERAWAHRRGERFGVFLSSSTDPFVPHEARFGVTAAVLEAMRRDPPDVLVVQTHGTGVLSAVPALVELAGRCELRVHLSLESDRDTLPGLPRPAATVAARLDALSALRAAGLRTVATVSPLLPIDDPEAFFAALAPRADAVVLDHFIGGDGSPDGSRTLRTPLPAAMEAVHPGSSRLAYRDAMLAVARRHLPGRVGVGIDGFAGRLLGA